MPEVATQPRNRNTIRMRNPNAARPIPPIRVARITRIAGTSFYRHPPGVVDNLARQVQVRHTAGRKRDGRRRSEIPQDDDVDTALDASRRTRCPLTGGSGWNVQV